MKPLIDDVRKAELDLRIEGKDGYILEGKSAMDQISRDPEDLVRQVIATIITIQMDLCCFWGRCSRQHKIAMLRAKDLPIKLVIVCPFQQRTWHVNK